MKDYKLDFLLEVKPELYSNKPNQYQIIDKDFGLYNRKEAIKIIVEQFMLR